MIKVNEIKKYSTVWCVSQSMDEMIYPKIATFISKESEKTNKLTMLLLNEKRVCYPTHLLFNTEKEAIIYASVNFMKLYYEFDPFFLAENIDEQTLIDAYSFIEKYEEEEPSIFLYHWMGNVPNKF